MIYNRACDIIPWFHDSRIPPLAWPQTQADEAWLGSGAITGVKYGHQSYAGIHGRCASSHSCCDLKRRHSFWRVSAEIVGRWAEPWAQNHGEEKKEENWRNFGLEEKSRCALTIECISKKKISPFWTFQIEFMLLNRWNHLFPGSSWPPGVWKKTKKKTPPAIFIILYSLFVRLGSSRGRPALPVRRAAPHL